LCHSDGLTVADSAISGSGWGRGGNDAPVSALFLAGPEAGLNTDTTTDITDKSGSRLRASRYGGKEAGTLRLPAR
jgi:hypothetical protein